MLESLKSLVELKLWLRLPAAEPAELATGLDLFSTSMCGSAYCITVSSALRSATKSRHQEQASRVQLNSDLAVFPILLAGIDAR